MALKAKNTFESNAQILTPVIKKFVKSTCQMFYYYLESCSISENSRGNIEVGYHGSNENGKDVTFFVEVADGNLKYINFPGLISGVDRKGKAIPGNKITNESIYFSALQLLLTDLSAWSEKYDCPISRLIFEGNTMDSNKYSHSKRDGDGEYRLFFGEGLVISDDAVGIRSKSSDNDEL